MCRIAPWSAKKGVSGLVNGDLLLHTLLNPDDRGHDSAEWPDGVKEVIWIRRVPVLKSVRSVVQL